MKTTKDNYLNNGKICVPCPAWLQRHMLKNLEKAARSRISKIRTQKADMLLKAIKGQTKSITSQAQDQPATAELSMESKKHIPQVYTSWILGVRKCLSRIFGRCVKSSSDIVKQIRIFRPSYNR